MASADPGLHWSIKRTFVLYVARLADGQILGGHGAGMADESTFIWPPATNDQGGADPGPRLAFTGDIVFRAHAGALSFRIADPIVDLGPATSTLTVASESGRIPLVTFTAHELAAPAGFASWRGVDVRLAEESLAMFAGYYGAGEPFDDLTLTVPADQAES